MTLETVARELLRRGHRVTAVERTADGGVIAGFSLLPPGLHPTWLKAVEAREATPDAVERALENWQGQCIRALVTGKPSAIVRQMVAEHGREAVMRALGVPDAA